MLIASALCLLLAAAPPPQRDEPVVVAVGGWVVGVKTGSGWKEGGKSLSGRTLHFATSSRNGVGRPVKAALAYSDGPLGPSLDLEKISEPDTIYVSGGRTRWTKVQRVGVHNPVYLRIVQEYAATKGKATLHVRLAEGIRADLNGDGKLEVVLAFGSSADAQRPTKQDFAALVVRVPVGRDVKLKEIAYETNFGYMRGPFTCRFIGAGDFDGDGTTEFLVEIRDPWGEEIRLLQLTKEGKLKTLSSAAQGE